MNQSTFIVLAQLPVKADCLEAVKALYAVTLVPTLQEPGCEVFYQTCKPDEPTTLIFFEVFTSREAFDRHMEADYTQAFFAGLQGKLSGEPISTILQAL